MKTHDRPWVLGIGASHNGAVCLLHGDEIVAAVQEERLVRHKRAEPPASRPSLAIQYCLDAAGITAASLSAIGVCTLGDDGPADDVYLNPQLRAAAQRIPVTTVSHHLGHAIGAFATCGFESASVLIVDGNGSPWTHLSPGELDVVRPAQRARYGPDDRSVHEIISIYSASETAVTPIEKHVALRPSPTALKHGMKPFFSLGRLFENVGDQIFGEPLDGPGKVMGLAPYGRPAIPVADFFEINGGEFLFRDAVQRRFTHDDRWPGRREEYTELAASVQQALEHAVVWLARHVREVLPSPRLCYAGGVALNSVANERIVRDGGFADVFIMPASEDSGTAIGAAYHALWQLAGRPARRRLAMDAVGRRYGDEEIQRAVASFPGLSVERSPDVVQHAADLLTAGKIVGWFQGRSELGPRALGQRSILADPRPPQMKDVLNARVKFREAFRPYAPLVPLERAGEWFEAPEGALESPFMLRVMSFKPGRRAEVPAVVHVDGTGRVQTVARDANPRLHALLTTFENRTGVPILLNTSFNMSGEPIVETPEDAARCLVFSGVDVCIVEDCVISKPSEYRSPLDWCPRLQCRWWSEVRAVPSQPRRAADESRRMMLISAAEGRLFDMNALADRYGGDHVRLISEGPWGRLVHFGTPELGTVLRLMAGRRTGWEILSRLNRDEPRYTPESFTGLLARLHGGRLITFAAAPAANRRPRRAAAAPARDPEPVAAAVAQSA
jgi:carbamoyltransferase